VLIEPFTQGRDLVGGPVQVDLAANLQLRHDTVDGSAPDKADLSRPEVLEHLLVVGLLLHISIDQGAETAVFQFKTEFAVIFVDDDRCRTDAPGGLGARDANQLATQIATDSLTQLLRAL